MPDLTNIGGNVDPSKFFENIGDAVAGSPVGDVAKAGAKKIGDIIIKDGGPTGAATAAPAGDARSPTLPPPVKDVPAPYFSESGEKGNPFLAANFFVAFLSLMEELMKAMRQQKEASGLEKVAGMERAQSLAESEAETIMDKAKLERNQLITQAVTSFVAAGISVGSAAYGMKGSRDNKQDAKSADKDMSDVKTQNNDLTMGKVKTNPETGKPIKGPDGQPVREGGGLRDKHGIDNDTPPAKVSEKRAEIDNKRIAKDKEVRQMDDNIKVQETKIQTMKSENASPKAIEAEQGKLANMKTTRSNSAAERDQAAADLKSVDKFTDNRTRMNDLQESKAMSLKKSDQSMSNVHTVTQITQMLSQGVNQTVEAIFKVPIAEKDAIRALLNASQEINRTGLQSATEDARTAEESIGKTVDLINQVSRTTREMIGWSPS